MNGRTKIVMGLAAVGFAYWCLGFFTSTDIANTPPRSGPIVAFGDSLTEGVGAPSGRAYPDQLSALIDRPIVNRGIRGETVGDALRRFDRDVLDLTPSIVLICLGGNDLLQRKNVDATFRDLESIVSRSSAGGAMVVLIGVEGLPLLSADFGERYEEIAERYGCIYVEDILDGIVGRGKLTADEIHPNADGYAIVAERIAKKLKPYL